MTNAEKIIELLESLRGPCCDDCISLRARVEPRQQVNQICRRLEGSGGLVREESVCVLCGTSKETNRSAARQPSAGQSPRRTASGDVRRLGPEEARNQLDRFCKGLWERRCAGRAPDGIAALISELSDQGAIPLHQANMMHTIRGLRNSYVHEHLAVGARERAVLANAWEIIAEWAESYEPELWGLSKR
jgi:hypothetical protein